MFPPHFHHVRQDVTRHLQRLIQINTTNPPGNEIRVATYLRDVLREEGYEPLILESAPGRANLVARLKGTGEKPPLLLMGHTDVVPAEPEHWTHPPFGGEIHDGYIWGRGAIDMKSLIATQLGLRVLFKRAQDAGESPLKRDLIWMAAADEETGGALGAGWLATHHPELIQAEYALNEGGGSGYKIGDQVYYSCQTAEKGFARFRLTAHGDPGHGAIPHRNMAIVTLAETISRLGNTPLPLHITETFRLYIDRVAATQPADLAKGLQTLLDPHQFDHALANLPLTSYQKRYLNSMARNTATPTILSGGSKINVIPAEATVQVDGRILPGFDRADFEHEIRPLLGTDVALEWLDYGAAMEAPVESPLFEVITAVMKTHQPDATVVPLLLTGGTDAKHIASLGTHVYGFAPILWEENPGLINTVHGHNERISIRALEFGVRTLYEIVYHFCQL